MLLLCISEFAAFLFLLLIKKGTSERVYCDSNSKIFNFLNFLASSHFVKGVESVSEVGAATRGLYSPLWEVWFSVGCGPTAHTKPCLAYIRVCLRAIEGLCQWNNLYVDWRANTVCLECDFIIRPRSSCFLNPYIQLLVLISCRKCGMLNVR